jgi:hypothetical protein
LAALLIGVAGCARTPAGVGQQAPLPGEPLVYQQMRAHDEAAGGVFVSLADFEPSASARPGSDQARWFSVYPDSPAASLEPVVTVTRTGAGALAVALPKDCCLVFSPPGGCDLSPYSLLSLAIHSRSVRDDLRVAISSSSGTWTSPRKLIMPGWNDVEVDVRRAEASRQFDAANVEKMAVYFADAPGEVRFFLDDVLLIDNERDIGPGPAGMVLSKSGLDYRIAMPGAGETIRLAQCPDGLWRLDRHQATLQLAAPGEALSSAGEQLDLMGDRRIGRVELLEHNAVRLRIANTWYFPGRAGEWLSMAVRRVRWEYTIYADGRFVTSATLNNAGGGEIGSLRMYLDRVAAWSPGVLASDLVVRDLRGPVGQWSYALGPEGPRSDVLASNYLASGRIDLLLAAADGSGDADGDGFDESQGCYRLRGVNGHCRFAVDPPADGLLDPVFAVAGPWRGPVSACCEGLAVRNVVVLPDGTALFALPGWIRRPVTVETVGRMPRRPADAGQDSPR